MKERTIYECSDGTRFDKKEDAMKYDSLLLKCSEVESLLGKARKLEYDEFIQRDAESVKSAWVKFCGIVAEAIPDEGNLKRKRQESGAEAPLFFMPVFDIPWHLC